MNEKNYYLIKKAIKRLRLRNVLIGLISKTGNSPNLLENKDGLKNKAVNWNFKRNIDIKYDLQIIVPVYNAEKYIEECLESVLSQKTNYSYIVTLVNDGSTDSSTEILKKYENDNKIQIVSRNNGGAAFARNVALENVLGRYIMFLDADDKLYDAGSLETLLDIAMANDADIVEGGYEIFDGPYFCEKHADVEIKEACGALWGYPWGKVIKYQLFDDICFPEGFWYEDTIMSYLVYTRSRVTYTVSDLVYSYRKNPSGFSHFKGKNDRFLDAYYVLIEVVGKMEKIGIKMNGSIYNQLIKSIITSCVRTMYLDDEKRIACIIGLSELIEKYNKEGFCSSYEQDSVFEKAILEHDYQKIKKLCFCFD